jgi:gliding motility-associated-like protein
MKSISRFLKGISLTLFAFSAALSAEAQGPITLPVCSGTGAGKIYFTSHDSLFVMDPVSTNITYTGITVPIAAGVPNATALAVSANLNGGTPSPTYYTTLSNGTSRYVHYWDGTSWINTGGILNSDHIAGGGGYLFSYDPNSGLVFRYNSSGTSFVANVHTGLGTVTGQSYDIAADCSGNFYVLFQGLSTPVMRKYSPTSPTTYALATTYTLAGTYATGGGGLAINGNNVYYDGSDGKLYTGVINSATSTVTFSASSTTPFASYVPDDFGSCGYAGYNGNLAASDTMNFCNGANTTLTATGAGPYNWTVVSGNAVISGTGQTVGVTATQTSVITHQDANCSGTNAIIDTTVLIIANATIDAGPDRTLYSCGSPLTDSIKATITNTTPSLSYAFYWTHVPAAPPVIVATNTDTTVIFQITQTTRFVLDVSTITGCHFRDSALIRVVDSTPKADFQYLYKYGCTEDTVIFFNYSTPVRGIDSFAWDFKDSVGNNGSYYYSDAVNPTHIFQGQGFYDVSLIAKNAYCADTITKQINVSHPIIPEFTIDDTTECSNHTFQFTSTSILPCSNPRYRPPYFPVCPVTFKYDFGDGTSARTANANHQYTHSGTYRVTLTLTDTFLHCTNSITHTVVVDSLPFVDIISPDTVICQGQAVHLTAKYLTVGNTGIDFTLGDGSAFQNMDNITYAFVTPGTYNVTLTAHYRYCPDATITVPFTVRPFPGIDIGNDTVMCPNGSALVLSDRANLGNTSASYLWSTGERTPSIYARNIGLYWARVDVGGCTATDSLMINKDCYIDIPNSFTPNNDGINDYFLPRQYLSRSVGSFKMTIFNRWGQEVFETTTIDGRGWDGKFNGADQPQGVYVYQIDVTFDNGTKEHYTGNMTLLR